jgi:hypothetical protein
VTSLYKRDQKALSKLSFLRFFPQAVVGGDGSFLFGDGKLRLVARERLFRAALVAAPFSLEYEARGYASAEEFIMEDWQVACNCVITDIHMPGMTVLISSGYSRISAPQCRSS